MSSGRDTPEYKKWRAIIVKRDKDTCQFPGCKKRFGKKEAHHILRWANYPTLRYEPTNGILLCWRCHNKIKGKEDYYAPTFAQIVRNKCSQ